MTTRWERSRNATIAHAPVHSEISSMHLITSALGPALLSSSVRYGIVSRSLPLTGKVLPGYLDATGLRLGHGLGNPNAEFSPDVSVSALSSDGGTAKVLWGFSHGAVGVISAPRAIDASRRPNTEMVRCTVDEQHIGSVLDAVWDDAAGAIVATAGADGTVKLWDAKTVRCLWTSEKNEALVPDACLKVSVSIARGSVATVTRSGDIALWTGFGFTPQAPVDITPVKLLRVSCPVIAPTTTTTEPTFVAYTVSALHIDSSSATPTLLVAYEDHPYFYRLCITEVGRVETTAFGDASFAPISALTPFFSVSPKDESRSKPHSSFVLAGDHLGCVSVYDWKLRAPATSEVTAVRCTRKFEAHEDGARVTALAWNGFTLITGSARGTTHVWDGLTFEHLRSFASPMPRVRGGWGAANAGNLGREVQQIIVGADGELLLVNVGEHVMAWKAGPVPRTNPGGVRGRHNGGGKRKKEKDGPAKYFQQMELNETILESKSILKLESDKVKKANDRARAQQARLESMGLDETEAVEYLLMLSRDEALQRENATASLGDLDAEDVFDFNQSSAHAASSSAMYAYEGSRTSTPTIPRPRLFHSHYDTQDEDASPPPESPNSTDEAHFPPMSASASPPAAPVTSSRASRSSASGSGSPKSVESASASAWSIPLRMSLPASTSTSAASSVHSSHSVGPREDGEEMDEELKFAIELSLAEARSRGENI
ncbi:hypothetical protein DXG03_001377 [Asterophora parasitica]|uniref:WD40 repeat-like protein n=1 Tax=Asterophora parasitica TaxID=117018 RepID=A0A9P7G6S0_9AGAR|nr:hypothetical protein DXG03_001377 [Asterophora parasitica]